MKDSKISYFPSIAIIILNWNGWRDTIECLESIQRINYPNFKIILVDNYSSDDSIERIREYCQGDLEINSEYYSFQKTNKPIKLREYDENEIKDEPLIANTICNSKIESGKEIIFLKARKNYYFVQGNNFAIKNFVLKNKKFDYILLLNNDTIVENNFLMELVDFIKEKDNVGIVGPRICKYSNPKLNEFKTLQDVKKPIERNYVSGAALLFRKKLLNVIGLLDSRFIHYYEDVDYCFSAKEKGYKVYYVPTRSKVLHKGSTSNKKKSGLVTYLKTRNNFIFLKKHYSLQKFLLSVFMFIVKNFLRDIRKYPSHKTLILRGFISAILLILRDENL